MSLKLNYFTITGYFITAEQYFNKNRKAYEEMKVFLSTFRLLSKVKAAILTTRTWYLSSDMPTRKYEKTDRANEIYKSELGLPIIPTSTERSIIPDHSLLFWDLPCSDTLTNNNEEGLEYDGISKVRFDLAAIPANFMSSEAITRKLRI